MMHAYLLMVMFLLAVMMLDIAYEFYNEVKPVYVNGKPMPKEFTPWVHPLEERHNKLTIQLAEIRRKLKHIA